jgi:hypothetical protein
MRTDNKGLLRLAIAAVSLMLTVNITASVPNPSFVSMMTLQTAPDVPTNFTGAGTINGVCIDGMANTYISGFFRGALNFSNANLLNTNGPIVLFCGRLDEAGNPVWLTNSTANLTPAAIVGNPNGGIALAGYFHGPVTNSFAGSTFVSTSDWGALILEINPSGAVTASFSLEANGTNTSFLVGTNIGPPFDIVAAQFDGAGNLYLAGNFIGALRMGGISLISPYGTNDQNFFLAKFDTNGVVQWAKQGGSPAPDELFDLMIDSATNIFVTGIFGGTNVFNNVSFAAPINDGDGFVMKMDSDGNTLWSKQASSVVGGFSRDFHSILTDGAGGCYLAGTTSSQDDTSGVYPSAFDAFIAHLDNSGSLQWLKPITATNGVVNVQLAGKDTNGNICFVGDFTAPLSLGGQLSLSPTNFDQSIIVGKMSSSGNFEWARLIVAQLLQESGVDPMGNTFVCGDFTSADLPGGTNLTTYGDVDTFITKLNSDGQFAWTVQLGGPQGSYGDNLMLDNSGGFYLTGVFTGTNYIQNNAFVSTGTMQSFLTHVVDTPPMPQLLQAGLEGADARLYWQGSGGFSYVVQSATNLSCMNAFQDISPAITLPGFGTVTTNFLDAGALTNSSTRFYRIRAN